MSNDDIVLGFGDRLVGAKYHDKYKKISDLSPELTGKNYVVTGASSGCGKSTAMELARKGARVYVLLIINLLLYSSSAFNYI
jgi:hypothetical protein